MKQLLPMFHVIGGVLALDFLLLAVWCLMHKVEVIPSSVYIWCGLAALVLIWNTTVAALSYTKGPTP